ncbi:hypothetical protein P280DRAFT_526417 [Massarina eburnea CBS 473.64]|uniref:Uncharacterized protein n=1 Tax=Massarina eburnea CBS 473.64 TaxID=1395130 RepID=A0A6A6RYL3_9PLEO|nr:hypothetical protein P280DRAFT_526417 [Massarina eburnea CBS 473.64]
MGRKNKRAAYDFIDSIKDDVLRGFPSTEMTIAADVNYRLDMQGITTKEPRCYNLQLQVNRGANLSTLRGLVSESVVVILLPCTEPLSMTPYEIKEELTRQVKKSNL